ncbi:hypothetical protein K438DRAFT_1982108 [Mycena galopus ATCC 62051]|nr:hypothetical protein K438DRAFT_1982108 [Mycena galopus ATCC 62051]
MQKTELRTKARPQAGMLVTEAAFVAPAQFASTANPGTLRNSTTEKFHQTGAEKEANNQTPADASLFLALTPLPSPTHPRTPTFGPCATCAPRSTGAGAVSSMQCSMVPWTLKDHANSGTNPSTTSSDALATLPASSLSPIQYPVFKPPLSADLISMDRSQQWQGGAFAGYAGESPTRIPSFQFQKASELAPADAHWASHLGCPEC